ncbi:hypothetical protein UA08_09285 [Talaromyces atroroseus]|uniref:Phosphotransferase n=1 Tax=Talaromyces atroroseus TaxID=1441469 RepID=A0A1Q5Q6S9_TALAT|nr:hypothetical protein UA08_09285 [Talaromyces atroroseus]OKL55450.1 hypothetical protein UA08_09285 [Talaromyces atroroseus]
MSRVLTKSFKTACSENDSTMLPSFIGEVTEFQENRVFLALDIGGSTMRAALVHVYRIRHGKQPPPSVMGLHSWDIDAGVRTLSGMAFLRWIAARVQLILSTVDAEKFWRTGSPIPMGLTWSFPFRQISVDDGYVLKTGKGFQCVDDLVGHKLNGLFQDALKAEISIILGTGFNAAIRLPVGVLSELHLKNHPDTWKKTKDHLIVNTELSLFGQSIVQNSEWDKTLQAQIRSACHQPLEYICGGLYLGEIVRLVMIDAIHENTLFNGQMPLGFEKQFSLSSPLAGLFEDDTSVGICQAKLAFSTQFPLPDGQYPSLSDLKYIRQIVRAISRRAGAYIAVSIHALHRFVQSLASDAGRSFQPRSISVGITGSVITKYPNLAKACLACLEEILKATEAFPGVSFEFNECECPTIIGAALAAYIIDQK